MSFGHAVLCTAGAVRAQRGFAVSTLDCFYLVLQPHPQDSPDVATDYDSNPGADLQASQLSCRSNDDHWGHYQILTW